MRVWAKALAIGAIVLGAVSAIPAAAQAQQAKQAAAVTADKVEPIHGTPSDPSTEWSVALGGRIYDNWWLALDKKKPEGRHKSYPAAAKGSATNTFRCKECHGWDYRGKDGEYASGDHATGIKGIRGAQGRSPAAIFDLLRAPLHGYTADMIGDEDLKRVAMFVSRGQHDVTRYITPKGDIRGDRTRGRAIFQNSCAVCHAYDGRLLNWGTKDNPEYIGTAVEISAPEVLHKIRNGNPGHAMINLRGFPMQDAVDVLAYAKTLPTK